MDKAIAAVLLNNLYRFNKQILQYKNKNDQLAKIPHLELCNVAQDWSNKRRKLILMPRGTFKCLSGNTPVTLANGKQIPASGVHVGHRILGWSKNGFESARVTAINLNEEEEINRILLRSGQAIELSNNHPVMTISGWKNAGELEEKERVLSWAGHEIGGEVSCSDEAWIIGMFLGDGTCRRCLLTMADHEIVSKTKEAAGNVGIKVVESTSKNSSYGYNVSNGIRELLREYRIEDCTSWDKFIPDKVWDYDLESKRSLIGAYFSCDGSFCQRSGKASITTVSEELAYGINNLLRTIGVFSSVRRYRYTYSAFYRININDPISIKNLLKCPIFGKKYRGYPSPQDGFWRSVPKLWREVKKPYRSRVQGIRIDNNYDTSFTKFRKFAEEVGMEWACGDEVVWDQVVEIEKHRSGSIDIEVENLHTFLAGQVVTHNSSAVTIGYTVQQICKDPNIRVLIGSEVNATAKKFLREIKDHFENNERLKYYYGDHVRTVSRWTDDEITSKRRTSNIKEPTVFTTGTDQSRTGFHCDLAIVDDPVSATNINTPESLEKTVNWYREISNNILEPGGHLIVIGTIWHFADLYQHILSEEIDDFDVVRKQAMSDEAYRILISERTIEEKERLIKEEDLIFPNRLDVKELWNKYRSSGRSMFNNQFMNRVMSDEDADFKEANLQFYDPADFRKELNIYVTIDPAISEKETADFTAIMCVGVDAESNWYVLEYENFRGKPQEIINKTFDMYARHHVRKIGVETQSYQKALMYSFKDEIAKRGVHLPLVELQRDNQVAKEMRIRGTLQPITEQKRLYIQQGMVELREQLRTFPRCKNDDLLDALSDIGQIIGGFRGGRGYGKILSREERDDLEATRKLRHSSRSRFTNY